MMAESVRAQSSDARPVSDVPDTLQNLCIFYIMNNLDILVASLNNVSNSTEDVSSVFSLLLGNRMLDYYLRCCLPSDYDTNFQDHLIQNSQLCNTISIKRQEILTTDNLEELANNTLKKAEITFFDMVPEVSEAYRHLLEKNLHSLVSLRLLQKCEEEQLIGFLNLICGQDFDSSFDEESSGEDPAGTKIKEEMVRTSPAGDNIPTGFEKVVANTRFHGFHIKNLNHTAGCVVGGAVGESDMADVKIKQCLPNLKHFSYEQIYTSLHPNVEPSSSFGWFIRLFLKILEANSQLKSFSMVSLICNPIEWFLSQPKLSCLTNLEHLCLVFENHSAATDASELGIPYNEHFFSNLPILTNVRHLDISSNGIDEEDGVAEDEYYYTESEVELFIQAVKDMPQLKYLDISGTNLCAIVGHRDKGDLQCQNHCMPGFEGRQFEFLGLYGHDACKHKFIPAHRVSGNQSMDQLLAALWTQQINKLMMCRVLEDILTWVQAHNVSSKQGLPLIDGLTSYLVKVGEWNGDYTEAETMEVKSVCLVFLCLYFVLRNDDVKTYITTQQRRLLLEQILVVCDILSRGTWRSSGKEQNNKIIRSAMLLILILDLDKIAYYSYRYEQYVRTLMGIFNSEAKESQRLLSLRLLHNACRVSQECKVVVGQKLQMMKKLLMIIMEKMTSREELDEVMEKVWSIIWTLTDEVPVNCELFVNSGGCRIARSCIQNYKDAKSLHRKITGAMNNVSENKSLVPALMTSELVSMFRGMLSYSGEEDYDVSSHSAGFLVMLASHGPEAWTVHNHCREEILKEIGDVMKKWDINKPKGVKFRSLTPMLTQIENYSTPVAQVWGAWLICNLIIIKPQRYCHMLQSENGLVKIDKVLNHPGHSPDVTELLEKIKTLTLDYLACHEIRDRDSDD